MASQSQKLNINGDLYSATNAKIEVNGAYRFGIRTITYSEELPKKEEYGTGKTAVGSTTGNYKVTVSVEILKHEADLLIHDLDTAALALGPDATYADVPFNLSARFQPNGLGKVLGLSAVEILGAKIMKHEEGIQTGGDAIVAKMDLHVIRPIRKTIKGKVVVMVKDPIDGFGSGLVPVGVPFGV